VAIVGRNGSGKSTLLALLATARRPAAGEIRWFGMGDGRSASVRRRLGVVFDNTPHFDALTGYQNALFFAACYRVSPAEAEARLEELFAWAGLDDARDQPVVEYSLGMKRRLAILEALSHRPALVLMDEPTLGLDHLGAGALAARLASVAAGGAAVVVATNDVSLADACDRRLVMAAGRLLAVPCRRAS
jgi:ABC-2 type transport system ATP-binding protein